MKKIPKFILEAYDVSTARQWRAEKRKEIRHALRVLCDVRRGCGWLENGVALANRANDALVQLLADNLERRR